jgi:hypothetical protein
MRKSRISFAIYISILLIWYLSEPGFNLFSQDLYKLSIPYSYNSLYLPGENELSPIGDTIYFDILDTSAINEINFYNVDIPPVSSISKKYYVIDTVISYPLPNTKNIPNRLYSISLSQIHGNLRFSFQLVTKPRSDHYARNKFIFIRKKVYDSFKNYLLQFKFDTDLELHTNINDIGEEDFHINRPLRYLSVLDTNDIKLFNLDSLEFGWKVKKVFVYGVENLFSLSDSIDYDYQCYDASGIGISHGPGHICLLAENYLQQTQLISLLQQYEILSTDKGPFTYVSGIPTIQQAKKLRRKFGQVNWWKTRFIHHRYSEDSNDIGYNGYSSNSLGGYYEPEILGNKVAYFKKTTLKPFSTYYSDHTKTVVSFAELYKNYFYLLTAYDNHFDSQIHSLEYVYHVIKKNPLFKDLKLNDKFTILGYHITFGSSGTEFVFLKGLFFSKY